MGKQEDPVQELGEKLKQRKTCVSLSNQEGGNGAAPQCGCIDHWHCHALSLCPHPRRLWLRWGQWCDRGRVQKWESIDVDIPATHCHT